MNIILPTKLCNSMIVYKPLAPKLRKDRSTKFLGDHGNLIQFTNWQIQITTRNSNQGTNFSLVTMEMKTRTKRGYVKYKNTSAKWRSLTRCGQEQGKQCMGSVWTHKENNTSIGIRKGLRHRPEHSERPLNTLKQDISLQYY